jgi:hypothetical protein
VPDVAAAVAAGVEAGVARALAQRAAEPAPSSSPPSPSSSPSPSAASSADGVTRARAQVRAARAVLRDRGLDLADLEGAVAVVDRVEGLVAKGDGAAAVELADDLERRARAVVVDRPLLLRRYERLNARARGASLDDGRRQTVTAGLGRASRAISAGNLDEAVQALVDVAAALDGP